MYTTSRSLLFYTCISDDKSCLSFFLHSQHTQQSYSLILILDCDPETLSLLWDVSASRPGWLHYSVAETFYIPATVSPAAFHAVIQFMSLLQRTIFSGSLSDWDLPKSNYLFYAHKVFPNMVIQKILYIIKTVHLICLSFISFMSKFPFPVSPWRRSPPFWPLVLLLGVWTWIYTKLSSNKFS